MMFDEGEYYYSPTEVFSSCLSSFSSSSNSSNKKNKMLNKRRFSDEQVRSLESIFENETKLEPKKKVQVAKELGLQPRQVAIWFQNKRARYKSKQLERDYNLMRANYNALASQFENLKKEKHSLFLQLKKLKEEMGGNKQEETQSLKGDGEEATKSEKEDKPDHMKDNQKITSEEWEAKPAMSMEGSEYGASMLSSSDEGSSENYANDYYFGMERGQTENMDEMLTTIMEPTTEEGNCWDDYPPPPEPETLFDKQAVDGCGHWWDFWS